MTHRRVLALLTLPLLLAGCVQQGPKVVTLGDQWAVVNAPTGERLGAVVSGRLVLDDEGCYALESDDGTIRPTLWPAGTFIDRGGLSIPGFDDAPDFGIGAGTPITAGGGEVPAEEAAPPCWDAAEDVVTINEDSAEYGFPR